MTTPTEKLNNTKRIFAANQVNLEEVSKKVAETQKAIQALSTNPGGPLSVLSTPAAAKTSTVTVAKFGGVKASPNITADQSTPGGTSTKIVSTGTPAQSTYPPVQGVKASPMILADQSTPGGTSVKIVTGPTVTTQSIRSPAMSLSLRKVCG
jgi:hypothetical protein